MKIANNGGVYILTDYRVKGGVLGITPRQCVNNVGVRSSKSVSSVLINIMSLYLSGDYLKGGGM